MPSPLCSSLIQCGRDPRRPTGRPRGGSNGYFSSCWWHSSWQPEPGPVSSSYYQYSTGRRRGWRKGWSGSGHTLHAHNLLKRSEMMVHTKRPPVKKSPFQVTLQEKWLFGCPWLTSWFTSPTPLGPPPRSVLPDSDPPDQQPPDPPPPGPTPPGPTPPSQHAGPHASWLIRVAGPGGESGGAGRRRPVCQLHPPQPARRT